MQLRDYLRFARRWLPGLALFAIICSVGTYVLTKYAIHPSYTATTTMQVQMAPPTTGVSDSANDTLFAETEAAVAGQHPVVNAAAQLVDRQDGYRIKPGMVSVTCAAAQLTALFSCSATSHDPRLAQDMANALGQVFMSQQQRWNQSRYSAVLDRLTRQEASARASHDKSQYASLVSIENSVRLAEAQQANIVRVASPATLPTGPSSPHPPLNAALAFVLALILGLGGAVVIDRLDESIRGEDDLKHVTHLPLLGQISELKALRRREASPESLVVVNEPRSLVAELFRIMRTNIGFSRIDDPPRVILITSTMPGEGKSMIAANLAATFAESGKSVILADLDLRRPSQHKIFEARGRGVTNLLLDLDGSTAADRYLTPTQLPGLHVLPSGPIPPNPADLLGSHRMKEVVAKLRERCDVLILDSPPVLAVADASIAASLSDTVLLVVDPNQAKRRALKGAVEALHSLHANVVGMIINGLSETSSGYYYSYTSGYRGNYYYEADAKGDVTPFNGKIAAGSK